MRSNKKYGIFTFWLINIQNSCQLFWFLPTYQLINYRAATINRFVVTIKLIGNYFDNRFEYFLKKKSQNSDSSLWKVNIFSFLSSSMTVNWISFGCGQNKTFEDVVLGFLTIFWHFIDKTTNWLIHKILDRLIDNENKC